MRCFSTATGAPLGVPLVGHTADVTSVAFHPAHPGGQVLLTASLDGTIRSWNAQDGSAGAVLDFNLTYNQRQYLYKAYGATTTR